MDEVRLIDAKALERNILGWDKETYRKAQHEAYENALNEIFDSPTIDPESLLGVTPDFRAGTQIKSRCVQQIIEAPIQAHSVKPDETRRRIVELLGDVPRIELFARQRAPGWDAWGDQAPEDGDPNI